MTSWQNRDTGEFPGFWERVRQAPEIFLEFHAISTTHFSYLNVSGWTIVRLVSLASRALPSHNVFGYHHE